MAKDKGKDKDKKKKKKDNKKDKQWVNYDYLQFHHEEATRQSRLPWGFLLLIVKVYWNANCQVAGFFFVILRLFALIAQNLRQRNALRACSIPPFNPRAGPLPVG